MLKNLKALGIDNLEHADRISTLSRLLREAYQGIKRVCACVGEWVETLSFNE